jgi:ABC-type transport system involved in multi-copper enzyme maturation permease subunit
MVFLSMCAMLSIQLIKMVYPDYFQRFSWSLVILALSFNTLVMILLSALAFLFASFTSTSFITLVLTVITYIIGHSINDVKAIVEAPQVVGIKVSSVTVKFVQIAYYLFPNLSFFDIKMQAAHSLPLTPSYIFWTVSYGLVYTALAITGAAILFRRREFP